MIRDTLLSGYKFLFFYDCVFKAGFQKISNIGEHAGVEYIHEGGNLGCDYPILSTKRHGGKLSFEKGYGHFNPFLDPFGFIPGRRISAPCSIFILDEGGQIARAFSFSTGLFVSWESTPLDAGRSEVLIDKVEIEHTGLFDIRI